MDRDTLTLMLQGSYDLHVHAAPSHVARSLDDFELVEQAAQAGMAGIMIKNHCESTAARAALANLKLSHLPTRAFGGVVLNWPAGGLNPYAVHSALHLGASFVWMPTRDAAWCLTYGDMPGDFFSRPGISIWDGSGRLLPQVYDIFDLVKQYDAVLATGHISVEESVSLCLAGIEAGVRMVLTHPDWERTVVDLSVQRDLAQKGVVLEKCWANVADGNCTAAYMAHTIKEVGAQNCFLTTDRGQLGKELPVEGYIQFAAALQEQGLSPQELSLMMKTVPAQLVRQ